MSEVNNSAVLKIIASKTREYNELNRLYIELGERFQKTLIDVVNLKKMVLQWEKANGVLQESFDACQREIEVLNNKIQELINDMIEEEWECPICKKTVFVGYTVHRHCFDSFSKELIEKFLNDLFGFNYSKTRTLEEQIRELIEKWQGRIK